METHMLGDLLTSYIQSIHTHNNSASEENNESLEESLEESIEESIEKSIEKSVELWNSTSQQLNHDNIDVSEIKKWIVTEDRNKDWKYLTDMEIIENVLNCNQEFEIENVKNNFSEEINNQSLKEVSHAQAYQYFQVIKEWCEQQDECEITHILLINKLLEIAAMKAMLEKVSEQI